MPQPIAPPPHDDSHVEPRRLTVGTLIAVAALAILIAAARAWSGIIMLGFGAILIAMGYWRRTPSFLKYAYSANVLMMTAGFMLIGYQLTGYFVA